MRIWLRYSTIGRPSIDPELLIRMLLVGYCRLGLEGNVQDHSTFSKNRHGRFRERDLLRELFDTVLRRCVVEGLVGGEGFAVDASLIKAEANRERGVRGDKGLPPDATSQAIDEYLAVLDDAAFGAATPVTPKFISTWDPASRWTGARKGPAFFQLPDPPAPRRHRRCRGLKISRVRRRAHEPERDALLPL